MIDLIKTIILDFQESFLETGIPRRLKIDVVSKKPSIFIGVRRSGKSTYNYQIIEKLKKEGVSPQNILYLNFFDDRLYNLKKVGLNIILEAYFSLFPEKKNSEKIYCFFDEIQEFDGWEKFIDRLIRTENCEIYITGSSAKMLSKEISTHMRGRALTWELFPFSFLEYLDFKGIDKVEKLTTKRRLLIQKSFEEYWEKGGFPEVLDVTKQTRIKIHQEYFNSILFRDLIERHNISHPKALIDLVHRLFENNASLYTVNSLLGYLKSQGHKTPKSAVSDYLSWLEDSYMLFSTTIYDSSVARRNTNPKKIYSIDHSLVRSVTSGIMINSGHLLENLVFIFLRTKTDKIYYYKSKSSKEVDFITVTEKRKNLIQVCEQMVDEKTFKREVSALEESMKEQKIAKGTIVTWRDEKEIKMGDKIIHVLPIWKFLLNTVLANATTLF